MAKAKGEIFYKWVKCPTLGWWYCGFRNAKLAHIWTVGDKWFGMKLGPEESTDMLGPFGSLADAKAFFEVKP